MTEFEVDPRLGAILDTRYRRQVAAMDRLVLQVEETLETDRTSRSITLLDLEHENLFNLFRVVLKEENCPLTDIAYLYMHLSSYMMMRSMYNELIDWGVDLFERYKRERTSPPAALFHCIALGYEGATRYDEALQAYQVILQYYSDSISEKDRTAIHYSLSRLLYFMNDLAQAIDYCQRALEHDRRMGHKRELAIVLAHYSELLWYSDQEPAALEAINEALELAVELGNMHLAATMVSQKAKIMVEIADPEEVISLFEGSIQLLEFRNDEIGLAQTFAQYAEFLHRQGHYDQSYAYFDRCVEIMERYSHPSLVSTRERIASLREWEKNQEATSDNDPQV